MEIKIVIDNDVLDEYNKYYFSKYPRRKKVQITKPIPPSLNTWMIMRRFQMNAQKQAWKDFGSWLVSYNGLENKKLEKCRIEIEYFLIVNVGMTPTIIHQRISLIHSLFQDY